MKIIMSLVNTLVIVLFWFSSPIFAADYYVATNGDNTNPGTEILPWKNISYAVGQISAGDTVNIKGGTYNEYIVINKSGTSSSPITLKANPGEIPIIEGGGQYGGIMIDQQTNIVIDGLVIRNTSAQGQGGGIGIFDSSDPAGEITIQNCVIYNNNSTDNAAGIYSARNLGTINIRNNVIHDNKGTNSTNETGITIFGLIGSGQSSKIEVSNNIIYNQGVGVKYKHPTGANGQFIVRNNLVHDIYGRSAIETIQNGSKIHNNIVYSVTSNESAAIRLGADYNVDNVEVYNNSVYDVAWGVYIQSGSTNSNIHDNIFYTRAQSGASGYGLFIGETPTTVSDYNVYYNGMPANWGGYGGGIAYSLNDLNAKGLDTHSFYANPLYINPTNDFTTGTGSPANTNGSFGQNIGAYSMGSDVIGISGTLIYSPPSPPPIIKK